MRTLSCCLVGYGGIAAFHADALKQIDGIHLRTLVGRRAEPAEEFRKKTGFEKATTDYGEAMSDPEVDAVVITTPSELHQKMTEAALNAGKDVLVEIPLAMSHKGARDLAALARHTGRKVMVAHTRRFQPAGLFAKDFIASGKAGRVHQHQSYSFWLRHENVGWTGYRRSWVDDVLFHHGCHLVDFSLWTISAPIRRVRGELSPLDPRTGTSLDVSLLIRYANECIATISLSYNSHQTASGNLFICDEGTLILSDDEVSFNGKVVFRADGGTEGGVLAQDREFFDAVREDRQPSCNAEEGLKALIPLQHIYDQMVTFEGDGRYRRMWTL